MAQRCFWVCYHKVCFSATWTYAGTLPDSWAEADAFPLLTDLTLADLPFQAGNLPAAWANNASFPQLTSLQLGLDELDSVSLSGSLPPAWGNPGAYPKLQSLTLGGSFTGMHSLATCSADMHHAMVMVHRLQNMHPSTYIQQQLFTAGRGAHQIMHADVLILDSFLCNFCW